MHIALILKNKERFIDGTLLKPFVIDSLYASWIRCNTMVLLPDQFYGLTLQLGFWKNLRPRFSQGDIFRIFDIQDEPCKFRQGNLEVSDYFMQLKILWDELENYQLLPFFYLLLNIFFPLSMNFTHLSRFIGMPISTNYKGNWFEPICKSITNRYSSTNSMFATSQENYVTSPRLHEIN